jgi:hypothetical protein
MNKRNLRSFAFGLFIAVTLIGSVYYFQNDSIQPTMKVDDATSFLAKKGYTVIKDSEYKDLKEKTSIQSKSTIPENKDEPLQESTKEKVQINSSADTPNSIINFQLEVESGMTSSEISTELAQNKIVDDEEDFANYLINKGYQTEIQLGSYSLTNRMSYDQIAKMITKK